ncbi:MAG TPA: hypothetical protein VM287_03835 [Egibacteraceae bacterium]|nr:hypothetical protein [Egibacteraceae bacterium]
MSGARLDEGSQGGPRPDDPATVQPSDDEPLTDEQVKRAVDAAAQTEPFAA